MLQIRGGSALSLFRQNKLLQRLTETLPAVRGVYAEYRHFISCDCALSETETARLHTLLQYAQPGLDAPLGSLCLVTPRPGTISPWSSKATDIAHNCGLSTIERIERGEGSTVQARPWKARRNRSGPITNSGLPACRTSA